jgi:hypothetical protein
VWSRADGAPSSQTQFDLDKTVCNGEMQKIALTEREEKIYLPGETNPLLAVFAGCMAQRGYVQRGK